MRQTITNPQLIISDYVDGGLSTAQVADKHNYKKNTVLHFLWRRGLLRPNFGKSIEREVAAWLYPLASSVFLTKGDCPFDLLVEGKRINVKSAKQSITRGKYTHHQFALSHRQSKADYRQHVDAFYLVFRDLPGRPVYSLEAREVDVKSGLNIASIETCKYPLKLLGYLDEKGGENS